ncbi:cell division protein FtsQ/DivIB [Corynebacterium gerontici]|uniref:Cell division protein FtsQ n=1 Tax=Corynebacterium gerontici TaxID=2079234 RepID=A0A3G6J156_9CORY|nr:FtsQ-type POTRA domain-containing protein [Corynebacterium gerontici]AZA11765.1 Cell division protein FtsQ [Corynebacterium gerontici]
MRKRVLIVTAIVAVLVLVLGAVAWFSPLIKVTNIEVTGNQHTSTEEVLTAADIPKEAKLLPLPSKEVAQRVSTLPWVAKVSVAKRLPDTVGIEVQEHEAVGYVPEDDGLHIFDASGTVFMISDDPAGATRVSVKDDAGQQAAAGVLGALQQEQRPLVKEIDANNPDAITLKLDEGKEIFWGSTDNMHNKAVAMNAALSREEKRVDISAAPDIAVR